MSTSRSPPQLSPDRPGLLVGDAVAQALGPAVREHALRLLEDRALDAPATDRAGHGAVFGDGQP